jgi:hypothetical protein
MNVLRWSGSAIEYEKPANVKLVETPQAEGRRREALEKAKNLQAQRPSCSPRACARIDATKL